MKILGPGFIRLEIPSLLPRTLPQVSAAYHKTPKYKAIAIWVRRTH